MSKSEQGEVGPTVNIKAVLQRFGELDTWLVNPGRYEGKPTITYAELSTLTELLANRFYDRVSTSSLARSEGPVSDSDLTLAQEVVFAVGEIEEEIIPNPLRRPWNTSVLEHVLQVDAFTWTITEEVLAKNSKFGLDINRMRAKAKFHDLGRAATHDPVMHGLVGRAIIKELGGSADLRRTALAHLEAGVGPYVVGITPEAWPQISNDQELLDRMVAGLPIEEVIIALADIGKKGIQQADGSFVNTISDPVEGLAPSAKRRLKTEKGEPEDRTLMDLASDDKETRHKAMEELRALGASDEHINKMAMYFGWMGALKKRLENECGVRFDGEDGLVAKAQVRYQALKQELGV